MLKKYKINVSIRKGMQDTPFTDFELDTERFNEAFMVKELSTFKDDAWLCFSLEELPEPEDVGVED
jgi:hypothetical protein